MHGDEAKDIQREAINRGQKVPPFVDGRQSSQDVFSKLRELKKIVLEPQKNPRHLTMSLEPGPKLS